MYLGLDLGTSGLRALLTDADGSPIAAAEASYGVSHPYPGWSEQAPSDWTIACRSALEALKKTHSGELAAIRGIGVSGQMHGATLLDDSGAVLRPCILWNDTRSHAEAAILDAAPQVRALSGNIVFPGFTAPKLLWLAKHEPDVFARVGKVLLPKDYLNFWLTGEYAGDMSDSAGTSWLDVGAREWSRPLLDAGGMRRDQMPDVFEGTEVMGTVRPDLAGELGLSAKVAVVAGAGDNAAAACGTGALIEGRGFVSLGTSGVLLAARDRFAPMPESAVHTFCHAVPDRWYQMGVILAATDSLNWLARNVQGDAADLVSSLGNTLRAPSSVRFIPYLSGERTPHNDSTIRGAFLGLDIATEQGDLTQAVIEGVSFALRDNLEALKSTGAKLDSVLAIGGGAQSRYWVELMATVLNLPLSLPASSELGAALGAARIAICGVTGTNPDDIMTPPPVREVIEPNKPLQDAFEARFATYQSTYPALKALT